MPSWETKVDSAQPSVSAKWFSWALALSSPAVRSAQHWTGYFMRGYTSHYRGSRGWSIREADSLSFHQGAWRQFLLWVRNPVHVYWGLAAVNGRCVGCSGVLAYSHQAGMFWWLWLMKALNSTTADWTRCQRQVLGSLDNASVGGLPHRQPVHLGKIKIPLQEEAQ